MPYCPKCGTQLPEDDQARFCPSCGLHLASGTYEEKISGVKAESYGETRIPSSRIRVAVLLGALALCFAVTSMGALARVNRSEAEDMIRDLKKFEEMLEAVGVQVIFGNNFMYCLIMFIPVLGPFYGSYVLYSTGRVLSAVGTAAGADPLLLFISLFIYPHAWMEYISYSLAISESFWLLYSLVKYRLKGFRRELTNASKAIAVCAVLLLLGAFIEVSLMQFAPA